MCMNTFHHLTIGKEPWCVWLGTPAGQDIELKARGSGPRILCSQLSRPLAEADAAKLRPFFREGAVGIKAGACPIMDPPPKAKLAGADRAAVRGFAERLAGGRRVMIEAGSRYSTKTESDPQLNVVLLGSDATLVDTDLHDYVRWGDVREIELTRDGRGVVDFCVSSLRPPGDGGGRNELLTNFTATWEGEKLVRLEGVPAAGGAKVVDTINQDN